MEDNRFLWPEMLRVIKEVKPLWVVGENVPDIQRLALKMVLSSLEDEGYEVETFNIPASAIGAWHRRERIWIIAYNSSNRLHKYELEKGCHIEPISPIVTKDFKSPDIDGKSMERHPRYEYSKEEWTDEIGRAGEGYWAFPWHEVAPGFCRDNDGLPNRMERIKGLGNAVVPQVVYMIYKMIEQAEHDMARH